MKAGFAEADITPATGMERPGSYIKRYVESVHDPLKVRVALFDNASEKIVLAGIDTCVFQRKTALKAKRRIFELSGIKEENVLIGASHTHTGGPLWGFHPEEDLQDAPELIKKLAFDFSVKIDPLYENSVIEKIAAAIMEADQKKEEVLLSFGRGYEDKVSFNRRFKMKSGKTITHPGKKNPDIDSPAGPIDPEVGVIGAWNKKNELIGCVVNFTCHGTTFSGSDASSGWVGHMENTIKGGIGNPEAVTVFLNGACGDVTQVDNLSLRKNRDRVDSSRHVGCRVGAEALKVLVSAEKGEGEPLEAISRKIKIKKRLPAKENVEKARRIIEENLQSPETHRSLEWCFAKERLLLDYAAKQDKDVSFDIQALQIGPAVFISMPGENFCQTGLEVKAASKFPFPWIVAYTAGLGYIPTKDAFGEGGGGYETALTSFSCFEPDSAEIISKACIELSNELSPGKIPEEPLLAEPGKIWNYGSPGPELN